LDDQGDAAAAFQAENQAEEAEAKLLQAEDAVNRLG
jgi:hypothetical protein